MRVFEGKLELHEPTYFASREIGILFQTEPVIGNYALTYALGLCSAPYGFRRGGPWDGGPRYKQDLEPLNGRGLYVTPATFDAGQLTFTVGQFNAQADSYYSRFGQNSIIVQRNIARDPTTNVPQSGRLRLLGIHSRATFFLLAEQSVPRLPAYIRLGKFNSKARIEWQERAASREQRDTATVRHYLNPADLPNLEALRAFDVLAVPPVPLIRNAQLGGEFVVLDANTLLPVGMRYGVETL
jgi:CRISPR-associated protein Csc1